MSLGLHQQFDGCDLTKTQQDPAAYVMLRCIKRSWAAFCLLPQDVELLEKMWGTIAEWQQLYNGWKDGSFGDLKVEEMEEAAGRVAKSLQRLGRETKHWPAWAWIKVRLQHGPCTSLICLLTPAS